MLVILLCSASVQGQPGELDSAFNIADTTSYLHYNIQAMVLLPDGRMMIADRGNLACYNAEGRIDNSFNSGSGFDYYVTAMALQPDGRILAGGQFSAYNGKACNHLVRLNQDGTEDLNFVSWSGINDIMIEAMARQSDGRILAAGLNKGYSGSSLVRLMDNGNPDPGFNFSVKNTDSSFAHINAVVLQPDGRILIGGNFNICNNAPASNIIRLNTDGSIDQTFNTGVGFGLVSSATIKCLAIQADGNIIAGGLFNTYSGRAQPNLIRLRQNGKHDTTFTSNATSIVRTLDIQTDGRIIAGGYSYKGIVRINADGSEDTGFNTGRGFYIGGNGFPPDGVLALKIQPDGKIVAMGEFASFDDTIRINALRLHRNGSLDNDFVIGGAFESQVTALVVQADSMILVGGKFQSYFGMPHAYLMRLYQDGSPDPSFHCFLNDKVSAIALQADGKILVGGEFTNCNGQPMNRLVRVNKDGTNDSTFHIGSGFDGSAANYYGRGILTIAVQADRKIIVGGAFTSFDGYSRNELLRLNNDGSLDTGFYIGSGIDQNASKVFCVNQCSIQTDGKVLAGGIFESYNGHIQNGIVRLNVDGSRDSDYEVGSSSDQNVYTFLLQPDDKVIALTYTLTPSQRRALRFNKDGKLDSSFAVVENERLGRLWAILPDGKILLSLDGQLIRLDSHGILDNSYFPGTVGTAYNYLGFYFPEISVIALQGDGKILVGGRFFTFNGKVRNNILRLHNCAIPSSLHQFSTATFGVLYSENIFQAPANNIRLTLFSGSLPPGLSIDNTGIISGIPSKPGNYSFTLNIDNGRCTDTLSYSIKVDYIIKDFAIYPNPVIDFLHIRSGYATPYGTYQICLRDVTGKIVLMHTLKFASAGEEVVVDMAYLSSANYILTLEHLQLKLIIKLLKL